MEDSTGDLFDGIFDNRRTNRREVWKGGKVVRYAARNACGPSESSWKELHAPWGTYLDHPINASIVEAA